jgi:hypothetical protein
MNDSIKGLYHKFDVQRTDGSSSKGGKHEKCDYFVLDLTHDKHAPAAIRAYAESCQNEYPMLAIDLLAKFSTAPTPAQSEIARLNKVIEVLCEKLGRFMTCPDTPNLNVECSDSECPICWRQWAENKVKEEKQ